MKQTPKIGKVRVNQTAYSPIEDAIHLSDYVEFHIGKRKVGAVLLKHKRKLQFRFAFRSTGIHPTLSKDALAKLCDSIESGLKSFPGREHMTIIFSSFASDTQRQRQLDDIYQQAPNAELKAILMSEKARVQQLTQQGIRKPKSLLIYCSASIDADAAGSEDGIEAIIQKVSSALGQRWLRFIGEDQNQQTLKLSRVFQKAFNEFQNWEQLISTQIGLDVVALTAEELWELQWQEFNDTVPRPLPQLVTYDGKLFHHSQATNQHPTSCMFETAAAVPTADREWVAYRNGYVGVMALEHKPGGWVDKAAQMRYLWSALSRDAVTDVRLVCTLTKGNEGLIKADLQRLQKQANVAQNVSARHASIDVANQLRSEIATQAQAKLYSGDVPLMLSLVFLVRRKTKGELEDACRFLTNCFQRPAGIEREREYAWRTWLQCQPQLTLERPLFTPFRRQKTFLSSEAIGLIPLLLTRQLDRSGFELIAEEAGTPIHIDLYTAHRNVFILATTRAGKSVTASGILTHALAHDMPVVAMDFPKQDGSSTFTDYTNLLGEQGAYFDISKESNNLFEIPDLRNLPRDEQLERMKDYKSFLVSALMTMVFGATSEDISADARIMRQNIRSVLTLALTTFFENSDIQERYDRALADGVGSHAWSRTPTLRDYLGFCTEETISRYTEVSQGARDAISQISLRLNFWLDSAVGKAIGTPSSFRTDAQLLVFALRGLSDDEDAAILSLSCYSAAVRRALASPASVFFIDEAPILFKYEEVAALVARLCANGAKSGVRVIISAQDPVTVARAKASADIFPNLSTKLIGRIQPAAQQNFIDILKIPPHLIAKNASESFFPKRDELYSQWLLEDSGTFTVCRYYAPYLQLAAVANNPDEQLARDAYMAEAAANGEAPLVGLVRFADELVAAIRQGRPIALPKKQPLTIHPLVA